MYDIPEELDYSKIEQEFEITQDYRDFILHYNRVMDIGVQYLIVKANWMLLLQEKEIYHRNMSFIGFIRKYQAHEDKRVKSLVLNAMYLQLKQDMEDLSNEVILERCNDLVDYAYEIEEHTAEVCVPLVFAYWTKAESIRKKDWRKSQHFYNKVIELSQRIIDDEHEVYKVRGQIAKVTLHLQHGHSEHIDKLFYKTLEKYTGHKNPTVINLIDEMIDSYIHHLVSEDAWFYQAEQSKKFIEYLSENSEVPKILLNSVVPERATPRLLWIAYAYWGAKQEVLYEQYLLRYFSFITSWDEALHTFKEYLQFDTVKDRKIFLDYTEDLHKRYVNLEKYRKLFRSEKTRR